MTHPNPQSPVSRTAGWNEWVDQLVDGQKPTTDDFVRSALTDLPRVETQVRQLDYRKWGFKSQAAMDAAYGESE